MGQHKDDEGITAIGYRKLTPDQHRPNAGRRLPMPLKCTLSYPFPFYLCLSLDSSMVIMIRAYMSSFVSSLYELLVSAKVFLGSAEGTRPLTLQNERVAKGFIRNKRKTPTYLGTRLVLGPKNCRDRYSVFSIADIDVQNTN